MIYVLDFNDKIIDFFFIDDFFLVRVIYKCNVNDNLEMFELFILLERVEKFCEWYCVIIRDLNK